MVNLKELKIYKLLKRSSFGMAYIALKIFGKRGRFFSLSKWISKNGDFNALVNYPLYKDSLVLDIGGYTGNFSDKIISLYNSNVIIFEPVRKYYKFLTNKYRNNKKVKVLNYGLSDKNVMQNIFLSDDGTSIIKRSHFQEKIELRDVGAEFQKYKLIDLVSINIEGAEYFVLPRLISSKNIKKIKYLQVQFHDFFPNSVKLRKKIINKILKTHKVKYSYPFVWESFQRKN